MAGERAPVHDRGKVLTHAMLMLAGGGNTCADVEALRVEDRLFGSVASDSTTYRTFRDIGPGVLGDIGEAFASVRHRVWSRSSVTNRADPVVLDIDASLVTRWLRGHCSDGCRVPPGANGRNPAALHRGLRRPRGGHRGAATLRRCEHRSWVNPYHLD